MALTEQQRTQRPHHVGASEVGALFGLDNRKSRYRLWHEKAGLLEPEDLDEVPWIYWGNTLEPAIAAGIASENGWEIRKVEEYWSAPDVRGMGASADFEIVNDPRGPIPLEIKNVDRLVFLDKGPDGGHHPSGWVNQMPPMKLRLQVQQQIACRPEGRAPAGILAALVGGNEPRIYHYDRHEEAIARMKREIPLFWESIDRGEAPEPDFYGDFDAIRSLYEAVREGSVEYFDNPRLVELAESYKAASKEEKEAEKSKKIAKAEILTIIKDIEEAHAPGWKILAAWREEVEIEAYTREAYRDFRIYPVTARAGGRRR